MKKLCTVLVAALLSLSVLTAVSCERTPGTSGVESRVEVVTDANGEVVTDANGNPETVVVVETTVAETTPASSSSQSSTPGTVPDAVIQLTFNGAELNGAPAGTVEVYTNADKTLSAFVIVKPGTYELSGDLSNGQVRVQIPETDRITLILNNFTASCSNSAPLYIVSADECDIELAAGSVNRLTDGSSYKFDNPADDKPNACLYAAADLDIKGSGSLIVNSSYNNGIGCKKDLKIKNGTITVSAPNNIIKGNNSVTVSGGHITCSGGEDGIKTDSEKEGKGFILISEDAEVSITCLDDALQATQSVTVEATAKVTVTAGGDTVNCPGVINVAEGALTTK